jgi:predicted deacetylase
MGDERKVSAAFRQFWLGSVTLTPYLAEMSQPRLLASIHDVGPRSETAFDLLHDRFAALGVATPALLVVPDHWGEAPIKPGTPFATRLRALADGGHEIFLHGWYHRDTGTHSGAASFKARHMTAGEGEFLGLDAGEAERRIRDGRALLEDIIGRPVTGFVAPAWLYGEGAHEALKATGIQLAEDHWRVWNPFTGAVLAKSPVITWASRTRMRRWSSLAVAAAARMVPLPKVVRLAVHPGDVTSPALLASISATLKSMLRTHAPGRYSDL